MKIADILECCLTDNFSNNSCAGFITKELMIPADNWDSHITNLLQRFQKLTGVDSRLNNTYDMLVTYLDKLQRSLRISKVNTVEQFNDFFEREELQAETLEQLLYNLDIVLAMESPDIKGIADALAENEQPVFLLGYTRVTPREFHAVPALVRLNKECIIPEVNAISTASKTDWIFSNVTSNLDEDIALHKKVSNTSMKPRNRLYPVFTRIPQANLARLYSLIPNINKTHISTLKCDIIPITSEI